MGRLKPDVIEAYRQLKALIAQDFGGGATGVGATSATSGGMEKHDLSGPWHSGQLAQSQAQWAASQAQLAAHAANINAHHAKLHALSDATHHSGQLPWAWLNKAGSSLGDLATRNYVQLNSRSHDIIGGDHAYTGGANLDVFGLSAASTLARLTPSADVSAGVAALLRSDAAGTLGLRKITSTVALDFDSATDVVRLLANNRIGTDNYASQVTGWAIDYLGGADFRYVYTDELHAKSFIADLEQALAGGQIVSKSVAVLAEDFALPAAGAAATLRVQDLPSAPNMAVFVSGDMIRLRKFSRAAGSLTIADAWGVVTGYADGSGANAGTQIWTFTRSAGALAGTATGTVSKDAIVLDYGTTGNGYYEVNAIDGAYALNSPYAQTVTWAVHPRSATAGEGLTVRTRMGNLRGLFSVANEYGFYAGNGSTEGDTYIRLSSYTNKINNLPLEWYTGGALRMRADSTHGLRLYSAAAGEDYSRGVRWYTGSQEFGGVYGWNQASGSGHVEVTMQSVGIGNQSSQVHVHAENASILYPATVSLSVDTAGSPNAYLTLSADYSQASNRKAQIRMFGEYLWADVAEVDFLGTVDVAGLLTGGNAHLSGDITADGALIASNGELGMSIGAPYNGYAIKAQTGNWARGFRFVNALNSMLGGYGAYGVDGVISYYWIGTAYNNAALRVYPDTNVVQGYGVWATTTMNATTSFQRDGVDGAIFVPMTPINAMDSSSNVWNGAARNVGTYTFDVNWADNGTIPAEAVAVAVFLTGAWVAASDNSHITLQSAGAPYSVLVRSHAPGVGCDAAGVVMINVNGQFTATISGANTTAALLRIVGYYI